MYDVKPRQSGERESVCHGLILAGGRSSRMGQDKALLPVDGEPLLARLIREMRSAVSGDIVVSVGSAERAALYRERLGQAAEGVAFVVDRIPEAGPVAGLATGLAALPAGYAYAVACDSPELSRLWVERLKRTAEESDVFALAIAAQGEPLHALYHTGVSLLANEALGEGDHRLMSLLRRAGAILLALTEREKAAYGLYNLNTRVQYESYLAGGNHTIEDR